MNTRRTAEEIDNVNNIAEEFAKQLKAEVGNSNMRQIIAKNYQVDYKGCCASHDYTDSNMIMESAFIEIIGHEPETDNGHELGLWNEAWDVARLADFYFDPRA